MLRYVVWPESNSVATGHWLGRAGAHNQISLCSSLELVPPPLVRHSRGAIFRAERTSLEKRRATLDGWPSCLSLLSAEDRATNSSLSLALVHLSLHSPMDTRGIERESHLLEANLSRSNSFSFSFSPTGSRRGRKNANTAHCSELQVATGRRARPTNFQQQQQQQ